MALSSLVLSLTGQSNYLHAATIGASLSTDALLLPVLPTWFSVHQPGKPAPPPVMTNGVLRACTRCHAKKIKVSDLANRSLTQLTRIQCDGTLNCKNCSDAGAPCEPYTRLRRIE